ncbi:peroxiredoxin [Spiroplasma endosymbiont of Labia minor]|uniref:peroxiredoxin n=1 Tax=Spiroplasma endosymbiont of Labia minor TaxID=3066305 RepID=UPI0030CACFFA
MKINLNETFKTDRNETISWAELLKNKKGLVLFFYPKAFTSGCSLEVAAYNKHINEFNTLNYTVAGISRDEITKNYDFSCEYELKYPLLSDKNDKIHKEFNVLGTRTDSNGENIENATIRSTFIIDNSGNVVKEFRNVEPVKHIDEVLTYIKN